MAKRLKKAFTITELVIVIAVVAILAAVLIPTFSNIIKKADESADTQLVKNLNTILSSEQTVSQEAAPTMSKALEQAQEGGYTVDKLTPTSDGDILWEQDSNRFVLVSGGEIIFKDGTTTADIATEPYKFWKITNKEADLAEEEYSHYLGAGFAGTEIAVIAGVDMGENTTVTSITYTSPVKSAPAAGAERTVIINTNKNRCNVTVDAPFDTVKRYGDAATVSVNETASQSYHEFGDVNTLVVGEGHVYVDEGGYVGILDCTKAGNATVGKASTGTINSVLVKDDSSAESILEDSVKTAIENGETEQVKASDVPAESSLFAGGIGTEKSPFLIETAEQFVAMASVSNAYFEILNKISLVGTTPNSFDDSGITVKYYIQQFNGNVLDGNGYELTIQNDASMINISTNATIKNLIVDNGSDQATAGSSAMVSYEARGVCTFDSVTARGVMNVNGNCGIFVTYAYKDITFKNCVNEVTAVGSGVAADYNAIFVGYIVGAENAPLTFNLNFIDCVNNGSLECGRAAVFVGNAPKKLSTVNLNVQNFTNTGSVRAMYTDYEANIFYAVAGAVFNVTYNNNVYEQEELSTISLPNYSQDRKDVVTASLAEDGTFTFTKSSYDNNSVAYYIVSYGLYVKWDASEGATNRFFITERVNATGAESYVSTMKVLPLTEEEGLDVIKTYNSANGEVIKVVENAEGQQMYYFEKEGHSLSGDPASFTLFSVTAYDAEGNIISTTAFNLNQLQQ